MKLYLKQRMFSWWDSYDIFDEKGETVFVVQGKPAWGHRLEIYDANGRFLGQIREKLFRWLPTFELYEGETYVGRIRKEFSWFRPRFTMDCGWQIEGKFLEWDYTVTDGTRVVATVQKDPFHLTDRYFIESEPQNALRALMIVLAIDAEKCSRND